MNHKSIVLNIPDMHCSSCPKLITITLSEIPGVISANASLETKQAVVEYDNTLVNPDQLIGAIKEIGYTASVL